MTRQMPLFPLGTVMFPGTALPLHVFEPRYRALMDDLTGGELGTPLITPEFGIALIERGHEVGGGDQRSRIGTVARLPDAHRLDDGRWVAL
ncbi:MAG: LON peptidase substrate-binding domain-containing protein, partial [Actinomycetota bacterium]|nr:LON peptidase substrate-binding domain-containing protein [Actinomycetota bacterium]